MNTLRERLSAVGNMYARGDESRLDSLAARARLPLDRAFLRRAGGFAALERLGASVSSVAPPPDGPRILLLALRGWPGHVAYETVMAQALRLRGAHVAALSCGGGQPLCEVGWSRKAYPRPCDRCAWHTQTVLGSSGLEHGTLADEFEWGADARRAPAEPPPATGDLDAAALGRISVAWFLRTSDPASVPDSAAAITDFDVSTSAVANVAERILDRARPDVVFAVNGLFAAERAVRAAALARGLRAPTYEIAPRAGALVFAQDAPAPEYENDLAWERVRERPLDTAQQAAIEGLLADRARGVGAHERYFDAPEAELGAMRARLGLPERGRVAGLFTNLTWDSATLEHDLGFASMLDWIEQAARAVDGLQDTTLVVRVHPAERRWGTREEIAPLLRARLGGRLPANVRLVGADEPLSTYALVDLSDLVLVYTTTVGLEAATRGRPVAVAGRTHYRGRGFTIDLEGQPDLVAALGEMPGPLDGALVELAHRYAFTFFYRCSIPFPALRIEDGRVAAAPADAAAIAPGADPYLDFVCDRIIDGGPFVLPDDLALPA